MGAGIDTDPSAMDRSGVIFIEQVLVDPNGDETLEDIPEMIQVINAGDADKDLSGWVLAISQTDGSTSKWTFPQGISLSSGRHLQVYWGTVGEISEAIVHTGPTNLTRLHNDGGDLALFNASNVMEHYVQWAQAGNTHEADAVDAGLWNIGESTPQPKQAEILQYNGSGFSANAWNLLSPQGPTAVEGSTWGAVKTVEHQ